MQHLPKKSEITMTSLLIEQRKSHNAMLNVLEVLVSEIKELKRQGNANTILCTNLEERVIPEVKQSLTDTMATMESKTVDLQGHGF